MDVIILTANDEIYYAKPEQKIRLKNNRYFLVVLTSIEVTGLIH